MKRNLAEMIRLISNKNGNEFTSSLKEELNDRLHRSMVNVYLQTSESLYKSETNIQEIEESVVVNRPTTTSSLNVSSKAEPSIPTLPKKRTFGKIKEEILNELISSLQESIRDEKTIVHRFLNGDTVTITNEDSQCLVRLHDSLNKMNQDKMRKLMSENYSEYNKILQFSKKYTERTQK